MRALLVQKDPLTDNEVTKFLQDLRENCIANQSHFAVAAVLKMMLENGMHAYVAGVNVENEEMNKLSMHAEQNAIVSAETLLGGNVKFTEVWVMGAPDTVHKGSDHFLANNHVQPCGHCRQILISLAEKESYVTSITVNGVKSEAQPLGSLLSNCFNEADIKGPTFSAQNANPEVSNNPSALHAKKYLPATLLDKTSVDDADIFHYLRFIKPHIIDANYKTSPIISCIIKIRTDDGAYHHIPGALVQDAAFLTTDATFAALGLACTQFGKKFQLENVYLYTDGMELSPTFTASAENTFLARFANRNSDISMQVFNAKGENIIFALSECILAKSWQLNAQLHPATELRQLSRTPPY